MSGQVVTCPDCGHERWAGSVLAAGRIRREHAEKCKAAKQ